MYNSSQKLSVFFILLWRMNNKLLATDGTFSLYWCKFCKSLIEYLYQIFSLSILLLTLPLFCSRTLIYGNAVLHKSYLITKVFIQKNRLLSKDLRRLLCNALIQLHFDYTCTAWYSNLKKKYKNKLQALQNKCIRFCLQLDSREHIGTDW